MTPEKAFFAVLVTLAVIVTAGITQSVREHQAAPQWVPVRTVGAAEVVQDPVSGACFILRGQGIAPIPCRKEGK